LLTNDDVSQYKKRLNYTKRLTS
jgi:predicted HD phosphohydrolase